MSKYIILILLFCLINNAICASDTTQVSKIELETVTVLPKKYKLKKFNMDKRRPIFNSYYSTPISFISKAINHNDLLFYAFNEKQSMNKFYVENIFIKMTNPNIIEFKNDVALYFVGVRDNNIIDEIKIDFDTIVVEKEGINIIIKKNFFFDTNCNKHFVKFRFLNKLDASFTSLNNSIFFGNYFKKEQTYISKDKRIEPISMHKSFLDYEKAYRDPEFLYDYQPLNLRYSITYSIL